MPFCKNCLGREHCCHQTVTEEIMTDTRANGSTFEYIRKKCAKCQLWLGDEVL
jgi:hypothetical protein